MEGYQPIRPRSPEPEKKPGILSRLVNVFKKKEEKPTTTTTQKAEGYQPIRPRTPEVNNEGYQPIRPRVSTDTSVPKPYATIKTPETPKEPSKIGTALRGAVNKVSEFVAGAAEAPVYSTGSKREILRNLPNEIVRTMLPGAAAVMDDPEMAGQITNKDLAKETGKVLHNVAVAPIVGSSLTFYGETNKRLQQLGLDPVGGVDGDSSRIAIKVPWGEYTNVQERIAREYADKPPPETVLGTIAAASKHTSFELLNMLYAASIAKKIFDPRIVSITMKGRVNIPPQSVPPPKTFQLYEPRYEFPVQPSIL
jgi:hypothetical protein